LHKQAVATLRNFQKLRLFPKRNRRNFDTAGNNSGAERKMLSSESIGLSKKAKGEIEDEL